MRVLLLLLLAGPLAACSSTRTLPQTAEGAGRLHRAFGGDRVRVFVQDGRWVDGRLVEARSDSVWVLPDAPAVLAPLAFALDDVRRVERTERVGGAVDGFLVGSAISLPPLMVLSVFSSLASIGDEERGRRIQRNYLLTYGGFALGTTAVGAHRGRRSTFVLAPQEGEDEAVATVSPLR